MAPRKSNIRLEFDAEVLRNEIFDVVDFPSFERFWQRFDHFLEDRLVAGHLNILEGHGLIPSDFQDVDGQLGYVAGGDQYQVPYDQLMRDWVITTR